MRGADVVNQYSWYIKEGDTYTDQLFVWPGNEHCLVLTGYDEDTVTVNDPQSGETQYDQGGFLPSLPGNWAVRAGHFRITGGRERIWTKESGGRWIS